MKNNNQSNIELDDNQYINNEGTCYFFISEDSLEDGDIGVDIFIKDIFDKGNTSDKDLSLQMTDLSYLESFTCTLSNDLETGDGNIDDIISDMKEYVLLFLSNEQQKHCSQQTINIYNSNKNNINLPFLA